MYYAYNRFRAKREMYWFYNDVSFFFFLCKSAHFITIMYIFLVENFIFFVFYLGYCFNIHIVSYLKLLEMVKLSKILFLTDLI